MAFSHQRITKFGNDTTPSLSPLLRSPGLVHPEGGHLLLKKMAGDSYGGNCPYHQDCVEGLCNAGSVADRKKISAMDLANVPDNDPGRRREEEEGRRREEEGGVIGDTGTISGLPRETVE